MKDELNRTYSSNKALKKQNEVFDLKIKELKKSVQELKIKNKELKQQSSQISQGSHISEV